MGVTMRMTRLPTRCSSSQTRSSIMSTCYVVGFKSQLDSYLRNIVDLPYWPGFNNSMDGGDCLQVTWSLCG